MPSAHSFDVFGGPSKVEALVSFKHVLASGGSRGDLLDEAEKTLLRWRNNGFVPPGRSATVEPIKFETTLDWNAVERRDNNAKMQAHGLRHADPYIVLHSLTGDAKYLGSIIEILIDWYSHIMSENGDVSRSWYDQSAGLRSLKVVYCIYHGLGRFGIRADNHLSVLWNIHITYLLNKDNIAVSNHGFFQLQGLKALSWVLPKSPLADLGAKCANDWMKELLEYQFDAHGVHREGAPHYHFYTIDLLRIIIDSPWWASEHDNINCQYLQKAESVSGGFILPNGRCVAVGDSTGAFIRDHEYLRELSLKRLGDLGNGYVFLRERSKEFETYLFVNAAYDTGVHKHDDCLSLVWCERSCEVLVDSGKYKPKGKVRDEVHGVDGHNTISIDGLGYIEAGGNEFSNAVESVEKVNHATWVIRCSMKWPNDTVSHTRWFILIAGKRLAVVDRVVCDHDAEIEFNWHFSENFYIKSHGSLFSTLQDREGVVGEVSCSQVAYRLLEGNSFLGDLVHPVSADWKERPKGAVGKRSTLVPHLVSNSVYNAKSMLSVSDFALNALDDEKMVNILSDECSRTFRVVLGSIEISI